MSQATVEVLRDGYEAFSRGDTSLARRLATEDVEWGSLGKFPGLRGIYHGPEAVVEWMDAIRSEWEEFDVTLGEVLHDADDVLVVSELLRGRGRESGVQVDMRIYAVYRFEGARIRRRQAFADRAEALAAAGADPA